MPRVAADQVLGHALDHGLGGEVRLRELRDRLAPADLAVVGRDLAEAEVAQRVEVVRLRIADRDRLDGLDSHRALFQEIAPRKSGMPETPTSTFSSRPNIGVASPVSVVPKSQT